jgi:ABC-type transporter Mla MlaB component
VRTGSLKSRLGHRRAAAVTVVYDDGVLRITRSGGSSLALAGEADESNYRGLTAVLAAEAHGMAEVHLSLSGLAFCDLAGLRAILRLARTGSADRDRRQLTLHDVPPQLAKVMRIVGWDTTPGLVIAPPGRRTRQPPWDG